METPKETVAKIKGIIDSMPGVFPQNMLATFIAEHDVAIRAECAERAVKCFLTAMAESGLSTGNEYAVLVIFDKIRAAIMEGKP